MTIRNSEANFNFWRPKRLRIPWILENLHQMRTHRRTGITILEQWRRQGFGWTHQMEMIISMQIMWMWVVSYHPLSFLITNWSFQSCNERNAYIATQAPLPSTFADFWGMIWQERSNVIVCITNMIEDGKVRDILSLITAQLITLQRKCDQYWPATPDVPQQFGNYQVTLTSESINSHFSHRILELKIAKSMPPAERKIHQLHFRGWPDHGVPDSVMPLLNFIHYTSDIHSTGPVVVHCRCVLWNRNSSYRKISALASADPAPTSSSTASAATSSASDVSTSSVIWPTWGAKERNLFRLL